MLTFYLILFGACGIVCSYLLSDRKYTALIASCLLIAFFSLYSFCFCLFLGLINFILIRFARKKAVFIATVIYNTGGLLLFHFIYTYYGWTGLLPTIYGVSYLSLQFIDYAYRVYSQQNAAPANISSYFWAALYFPKFFAGPIVSLPELEAQQAEKRQAEIPYGINRLLLGIFKKLVLAESLSVYVHSVLDFHDLYPGLTIFAGACLYTLQLYFDFSGYCDMAIGASSCWGITLPENFLFPFRQKSWGAFWQSWHSTLTGWLWQYIFRPLYLFFSRKKINKHFAFAASLFLVFMGMAFFNGIQSGFYISGILFTLFYAGQHFMQAKQTESKGFFNPVAIFFLFSTGLIFFRNPGYSSYAYLTGRLSDVKTFLPTHWLKQFFAPLASGGALQDYFNFSLTLLLCLVFLLSERKLFVVFSARRVNFTAVFILLALLLGWGVFTSGERFIYMQF